MGWRGVAGKAFLAPTPRAGFLRKKVQKPCQKQVRAAHMRPGDENAVTDADTVNAVVA